MTAGVGVAQKSAAAVAELCAEADRLFAAGELAAAKQSFIKLSTVTPDPAWCFFQLGRIAARSGDWAEAVSRFDDSLACSNRINWCYFDRASARHHTGHPAEAIVDDLREFVRSAPPNLSDAHFAAVLRGAHEAFALKMYDAGHALYEFLHERGRSEYVVQLRRADLRLLRDDPIAALEILGEAAPAPEPDVWANVVRAGALIKLGRDAEAAGLMASSVSRDPTNPVAARILSTALEVSGDAGRNLGARIIQLSDFAESTVRAVAAAMLSPARSARKRVAVVCWDLSHNPVGRAYVLYKLLEEEWTVDLIGPIWPRFGSELWHPLRSENLTIKSFLALSLTDVWREGAALALANTYSLVLICKPRLPCLIIGLLLAEQSRCPIIVDIDENELAFSPRQKRGPGVDRELTGEPFGALGTDLALQYIDIADAVTVSNLSLLRQFPGHVVRHARTDLTLPIDRADARRRLGFSDDDFVIAFLGTPRAHKGLSHVLDALQQLPDPSVRLLLAGSIDNEIEQEIVAHDLSERVVRQREFSICDCSALLAVADLVPLLQDPDALISQTQMPAKFTDAMRAGVRVVATDVPPFREMAERGGVDIIGASARDFRDYVARLRAERPSGGVGERNRRLFQDEFSFAVNRARLRGAIAEAFVRKNSAGSRVEAALRSLLSRTQTAYAAARADQNKGRSAARKTPTLNIAFFWKQNDSDLFGRRSDMVVKHLLKSRRVNRIVHFDHMVALPDLRQMAMERARGRSTTDALQLRTTLNRALRLADEPQLNRRLFIYSEDSATASFLGERAGSAAGHAAMVREELAREGLEPGQTIAWVCPVVVGFGNLARELGFRKVVCDLIDDERSWSVSETVRSELQAEYQATLQISDLVLTNCEENRRRFSPWYSGIVVMPNGAELSDDPLHGEPPAQLRGLPRPRIGYIGNLSDRIDWDIVGGIARRRPSWSIVLAGPVKEERIPDSVRECVNVLFPGPVPYEDSRLWMRQFDVAIVPHLVSDMTGAMNPLKVYNYLAAGCPVVSTPISGLDDVVDLLSVCHDMDGFIAAIEANLKAGSRTVPLERIRKFSWDQRVGDMLKRIEGILVER